MLETKQRFTNIKIAIEIQHLTPIRHFDGLQIYQNEQNMLYRAKKLPLEPKL